MDIRLILVQAFVILFAITVHEAAHAWAANKLGDPTAAALGRASLNPIVHIDLFGTIIFPLLLILFKQPVFGWAKPVPFNPRNLRDPRKGGLWISFAGPIANIATAGAAVLLFRILRLFGARITDVSALSRPLEGLSVILLFTALINISLAVEVDLGLPLEVAEIVPGDGGDGDVVDVDLLLADEEEQEVERAFEDVQADLVALEGLGGRRGEGVLDRQGFGDVFGHAR